MMSDTRYQALQKHDSKDVAGIICAPKCHYLLELATQQDHTAAASKSTLLRACSRHNLCRSTDAGLERGLQARVDGGVRRLASKEQPTPAGRCQSFPITRLGTCAAGVPIEHVPKWLEASNIELR